MMCEAVVKDKLPNSMVEEAIEPGLTLREKHLFFHPVFFVAFTILFLFLFSFVFHAMGYNMWSIFVSWDDEIMEVRVSSQENITWPGYEYNLKPAFDDAFFQRQKELEIAPLLPSWMPDGFVLEHVEGKIERSITRWAVGMYTCGDRQLKIGVYKYRLFSLNMWIEKDEREPEIYDRGGIRFYIMDNLKRAVVHWFDPPYDIHITGHVTRDELRQMIDSMFERQW